LILFLFCLFDGEIKLGEGGDVILQFLLNGYNIFLKLVELDGSCLVVLDALDVLVFPDVVDIQFELCYPGEDIAVILSVVFEVGQVVYDVQQRHVLVVLAAQSVQLLFDCFKLHDIGNGLLDYRKTHLISSLNAMNH
jgi:hypothetical protein